MGKNSKMNRNTFFISLRIFIVVVKWPGDVWRYVACNMFDRTLKYSLNICSLKVGNDFFIKQRKKI